MEDDDHFGELLYPSIPSHAYPNLERLICLALADPLFTERLLADPVAALGGLPGDVQLSPAEREIVLSVSGASDIHSFSALVYEKLSQECVTQHDVGPEGRCRCGPPCSDSP